MPEILITIPVWNEGSRLEASVSSLKRELDDSGLNYTLSIAEDGSTDETPEVLKRIRELFPRVLIVTNPVRMGRGKALRVLWTRIRAEYYVFVDADLAMGPGAVVSLVKELKAGAEIVVGSRYVPGAIMIRPPLRALASRGYNLLVRQMFQESIRDHQCGLKGFKRSTLDALLPRCQEDSWFWDTEVLVVASRLGFTVIELPVKWIESKNPRTGVRRLFSDILLHGSGLLRISNQVGRELSAPVLPPASDLSESKTESPQQS